MACISKQWNIESLPNELLLNITSYVCTSQSSYRTLLLINTRFHALVQPYHLPQVPIRLNLSSAPPFYNFIVKRGLSGYIRYLWINGTSTQCSQIVAACHNLIALACSFILLYSVCEPLPPTNSFVHLKLRELTVFDYCSWNLFKLGPNGGVLCRQITHLRLHVTHSVPVELAAPNLLPSLTHLSCVIDMNTPLLGNWNPRLEQLVLTTFFWKNEPPDERTQRVLRVDSRVRILYFGPNEPGEFELWSGRARKSDCIWTRCAEPRRLI